MCVCCKSTTVNYLIHYHTILYEKSSFVTKLNQFGEGLRLVDIVP